MTKTCTKCGVDQDETEFEKGRRQCKSCRAAIKKEQREKKRRRKAPEASVSASKALPDVTPQELVEGPVRASERPLRASPEDELKKDFRKFLFVVWKHINLPDPTPIQYDIAHFIATGPKRICVQAFRGVGKSFVTAAYVLWELYRNPQLKIMVVSATKERSDAFSTFLKRLIEEMPLLMHLRPRAGQRDSKIAFDVGPALADQSPSVKSVGITGQLTGSRADIIVSDDVEILNNSATADMREKLLNLTKEYSAILKPLDTSKIIYLGTPQTEDSIYNKLSDIFTTRIWPARIPSQKELESYSDRLAPRVAKMVETASEGDPVDPVRFNSDDLLIREADYGKAGFSLQFMLNTALSDLEKYPLKVKDLLIMDVQSERAPMKIEWLPDPQRVLKDVHNVAMAGDKMYAPAGWSNSWSEYEGKVMAIDPSGRGKDETGFAVVNSLNGMLFARRFGGIQGGYDDETLKKLAMIAKEEEVNKIIIESNFGDGMFTKLFQPVLRAIYNVSIEEVRHSTQKERRIIDTLEPVMARHKLVVDKSALEEDYRSAQKYDIETRLAKTLVYQMTRISYDRGSLKHDDRLDALAMAVGYWTEKMARDQDEGINRARQEYFEEQLKGFLSNASPSNYRHQRKSAMSWT